MSSACLKRNVKFLGVLLLPSIYYKQEEWPHHHVFSHDGKPSIYEQLTLPQFCMGYATIMNSQKPRRRELMSAHLLS